MLQEKQHIGVNGGGCTAGKECGLGRKVGKGLIAQALAPMSCHGNQGGEGSRGHPVRQERKLVGSVQGHCGARPQWLRPEEG